MAGKAKLGREKYTAEGEGENALLHIYSSFPQTTVQSDCARSSSAIEAKNCSGLYVFL